jgi:hypothetical protein
MAELHVCIGGAKVEEFEHEGSTYIECNLADPSSYKVPMQENSRSEDVALWPVTPYTVQIRSTSQDAIWATLFVDGCRIAKHLVKAGQCKLIEGIDDGSAIKELLFSFPRLVESEKDRLSNERLAAGDSGLNTFRARE